jgi:hypothetical protein
MGTLSPAKKERDTEKRTWLVVGWGFYYYLFSASLVGRKSIWLSAQTHFVGYILKIFSAAVRGAKSATDLCAGPLGRFTNSPLSNQ